MKDLKNLKGAKMLSKMEQKVIKGGRPIFDLSCNGIVCPSNTNCCTPTTNLCGIFSDKICIAI